MEHKAKPRIQEKYQHAVDEFVGRAVAKYGDRIEHIILFGSVARGEARDESDIDILIVTKKEDFKVRRELIGIAFDVLLDTGENISVKVLSRDRFEGQKNFSFLRKVISEGVRVA